MDEALCARRYRRRTRARRRRSILFRAAPGEAPAVFYFDATLTYAELDRLSDRLAAWLSERGVGSGDRVAIVLQNTPQFLIAAVAAWKLAAIVVSLNPMYRTPELSKLFADCEPKVDYLPRRSVGHCLRRSRLPSIRR